MKEKLRGRAIHRRYSTKCSEIPDEAVKLDKPLAAIILEAPVGFDMTKETFFLTPVQRLIKIFQLAGASRVAIAGDAGMKQVEQTCTRRGAMFFRPRKRDSGVSGGLKAALKFLQDKCDRALIAPANFPMFETETARRMAESGGTVAVPVLNGVRGWPVCVSADMFRTMVERGWDLDDLISGRTVREIKTDDAGVCFDATVSDIEPLASAHSLHTKQHFRCKFALAYEKRYFGIGMLQLLRLIDEAGSVEQAIKLMGMASSRAQALMNGFKKYTGIEIFKVVKRGAHGPNNKNIFSDECRAFLDRYEAFIDECAQACEGIFARCYGDDA